MYKFLIDECLSPALAGLAHEAGHVASHVNFLKLNNTRDQVIAVYAVAEDYVFVTNNGADYKPIYKALDLHPGLVVILPNRRRVEQVAMFREVMRRLEDEPDTVNKLIEVDGEGRVSIRDFPPLSENL
jgi:predicted nuclease of predicted toxin-antitoxin system